MADFGKNFRFGRLNIEKTAMEWESALSFVSLTYWCGIVINALPVALGLNLFSNIPIIP